MPIKVLHFICSTGFYGAERWILALANNIDRKQICSELAVTREHEGHDLELNESFKTLDLPVHEMRMNGRFDIRVISELCRIVRLNNINIIHTHGYKSDILGILVAKRTGIKSICTPHGFENSTDWKLRFYTWIGGRSFRHFDYVVPLSKQLYSDVKAYGVPEKRIRLIANGVDLKPVEELLSSRSSEGQNFGDDETNGKILTVGYIGQLIDRKNVKDVLDVFDALASDRVDVQLEILGDGESRAGLQKHAQSLKSASRIKFLGFVNEPLRYLANFDLFVMTSSLEGIPRCLMESMAMGVPVAAYRISGVDQLITHHQTGLLADFGDKHSLLAHWRSLLFDADLALQLAKNAKQFVRERYSAQRMADEYEGLYRECMDISAE